MMAYQEANACGKSRTGNFERNKQAKSIEANQTKQTDFEKRISRFNIAA